MKRRPPVGVAGTVLRLAAALALAWAAGLIWFVATLPGAAAVALTTDGVVVPTGGPGRLARGIEVSKAGSASRLLVSGVGPGADKATLADATGAPRGLFTTRIDLGTGAVDTRSNAEETAAWARAHGFHSLRLVTSAAHMRRALLELRLRLPAEVAVLPDAVPVEEGADSVAREYTKYLLRRAAVMVGR